MSPFRRRALVVAAVTFGALVVVLLIVLPLMVRVVAVDRLSRMTGRGVALADVDLNLFTGRLALHRFRLAQRGSDAPALEIERLGFRVAPTSLVTGNVRVSELTVTTPRLYVARLGPGRYDFDDLLALIPPPDPNKPPAKSTTTLTLERLTLERGLVVARDEAVTPAATWRLENLAIDGADLSTRPGARPGRLAVHGRVNGAAVGLEADPVELPRTAVDARVTLSGFDVTRAVPYIPSTVPVVPTAGRLALDLQVKASWPAEGPQHVLVGGTAGLSEIAVLRRGAPAPLLSVPRINVVIKDARPLEHLVTLAALEVDGFDLRAVRDRQGQIDLLALAQPADASSPAAPAPVPPAQPSPSPPEAGRAPAPAAAETPAAPLTIAIERVALTKARFTLRDESVTPPATWRLEDLAVDGADLSTRPGARPGRLAVRGRVNGAAVGLDADAVELARTAVAARVTLRAFDVPQVVPYIPSTVSVVPTAGRLTLDLRVKMSRPAEGPQHVLVGGTVGLADVTVLRRGSSAPLLRVPKINVVVKEARPLESFVTLAALEVQGLDLSAVRDRQGQIDLLTLAQPADGAPAAPAPVPPRRPSASPPAGRPAAPPTAQSPAPPPRITVQRVTLAKARFALRDEAASPVTTLTASDIGATVTNVTWPGSTPLALEVSFALPTAGRVTVKGTATLSPFSADVTTSLRDGVIEPYYPYIPFKARLAGRFNGDSRSRVAVDTAGRVTATSTGTSWIEGLEVRNPDDNSTPLKVERLELAGIDFGWPTHARVATVTVRRPNARIERDAGGAIRLRELFEVQGPESTPAPAPPPPAKPAKPTANARKSDPVPPDVQARGGAVGFPLDVGAFVLEDGSVQFLDRTVQPAFSETLARLAITIEGLSSTPGRVAKLTTQAIVGGDAALDMQGELAPLGELYGDIRGELRDFTLARVNPYADSFVSWIVDRGKLAVRFHYRVERGQLEASNEIVIENIHVAPSRQEDEVKKRIGLPLGLIVALITDAHNDLKVNLPMSGPLEKWKADFSDAIWTVVKNVLVNVAAAPFRAIGRLFTSGDNKVESLRIEPITFPAGGDVIANGMAQHLIKVADFLRRAPAIRLSLTPFASAADLDNLKSQELTARLQAVQREKKLPDFAAAVGAEFKARFPAPPGAPPPAPDAQLARLREAEPLPDSKVTELLQRRVSAVREGLVKDQGIPESRLRPAEPRETAVTGTPGRVEFSIGQ